MFVATDKVGGGGGVQGLLHIFKKNKDIKSAAEDPLSW